MQSLKFFSMLCTLFFASLLLTACGDKASTEPASSKESNQQPSSSSTASTATGFDAHPGKTLHDANCISCHDAKVYTRPERKILDYTQLAAQVRRCDANLGSRLFDEDLAQITDYLNQAYYKYPKQ